MVGGGSAATSELAGAVADVPEAAMVVAADSGLATAMEHGLRVHHVVGDLDSVDPGLVTRAAAGGALVHRHPADKDATDSELALNLAIELTVGRAAEPEADPAPERPTGRDEVEADDGDGGGAPGLLVLGGGGGRLDHLMADLSSLLSPRLAGLEVSARFGPAVVHVVRPGRGRLVGGAVGEYVSLLALHGPVGGVTTTGLRWALADADLVPGATRAISNEITSTEAAVSTTEGALLVVRPGLIADPVDPRPAADVPALDHPPLS